MKKVIIIGAGPAGITAGYELLKQSNEYEVTILEESSCAGGISRTEVHNGHRMDIGGHRFFSKSKEVNDWWENIMPMQGAPAYDDDKLNRDVPLVKGGPDPARADRVMLNRSRISHIYYKRKFFEYPVRMNMDTIKNMGFGTTMQAGFSYLGSMIAKKPENSLENFYINQFGKKLYSMFFEGYTEKLWGRHPREIDPSWGAQRTKGLSITEIVKDATRKALHKENKDVNTSLIGAFKYPKLGPGQLWEAAAADFEEMGGSIHYNCQVIRINTVGNKVESVICAVDGITIEEKADIVISSMPIKDLIIGMNGVPSNVVEVARKLPYRDFVTVGLLVPKLRISNTTYIRTLGNVIPDTWIYVQDTGIKMGRIQIFNNWSPYLLENPEKTVWVGLEYFCNEGDRYWNMTDEEWIQFATKELIQMGILSESAKVLDAHKVAVKKAYPAYFDTYSRFDEVRTYLDKFENLYCVGRNGQHRYNNMDHSMMTSFEAVKNILGGIKDKSNIWNVNTEQEYHEEKTEKEQDHTAESKSAASVAPVPPVKEMPKSVEETSAATVQSAPVKADTPVVKEEDLQAAVKAVPAPPVRKQLRRNPLPTNVAQPVETGAEPQTESASVVVTPAIATVFATAPVQPAVQITAQEITEVIPEAEMHVSKSRSIWEDVEYAEATAAVKTAPIRFKTVEEAHAAVKGNVGEKEEEKQEEVKEKKETKKTVKKSKTAENKADKTEEKAVESKPSKSGRKKKAVETDIVKAEEKTEAVTEETKKAVVAEAVAEGTKKAVTTEAAVEEGKKPSRSRRKKPAELQEAAVTEAKAVEAAEEAPKSEVKEEVVAEEPKKEVAPEATVEEEKKPSRSRRKKPAEMQEVATTETKKVESVEEEKKLSRTRRKKPVEMQEVATTETKADETAEEEPKSEVKEVVAEETVAEVKEVVAEETVAEATEVVAEETVAEVTEVAEETVAEATEVAEETVAEVTEVAEETVVEATEIATEVVEAKAEAVQEEVTQRVSHARSTSGKTIAGRSASHRSSANRHASNRRKVENEEKKISRVGKEATVGNMKGTVIKSNVIQKTGDMVSSGYNNKTKR